MSEALLRIFNECEHISNDSRNIRAGSIFIAYQGHQQDGRNFIEEALKKGADYVLYDPNNFEIKNIDLSKLIPIPNLKEKISSIAAEFYKYPSKHIEVIGVTGTNGKTTVTGWLNECLTLLKKKTAWIGTLGFGDRENINNSLNTTPDAILIQNIISNYVKKKFDYIVIEVSSHAIHQKRISDIDFSTKILTNVSRDHLDYHSTIENYEAIKKSFFESGKAKFMVINNDDHIGRNLNLKKIKDKKIISYGILNDADLLAQNIVYGMQTTFDLIYGENLYKVKCNFFGRHNIYNLLSVIATLVGYDFSLEQIIKCVSKLKNINGRLEIIKNDKKNKPKIFLDYAHTPDALENVLQALKDSFLKKIILVFGCGGDRDKGKRKEMGLIANNFADQIIVTSDNPRNENPKKIMLEIVSEISKPFVMIEDRREAIKNAIDNINDDSIILIAGKGHEEYQEIKGEKITFSDKEVVLEILKNYD